MPCLSSFFSMVEGQPTPCGWLALLALLAGLCLPRTQTRCSLLPQPRPDAGRLLTLPELSSLPTGVDHAAAQPPARHLPRV